MVRWWTEGDENGRVLEAVLRVGVAGCFIGHGAFGILGKEAWLPYFAVAGVPEEWAWILMPLVGGVDILVGILALLSPRPAILAYAAGWAVWTALLRPLAGESFFETLERAGNYGVPLALLVAAGFRARGASLRDWIRPLRPLELTPEVQERLSWVLRATTALLLVGHGGLAIGGKPLLAEHMGIVGMNTGLLPAMGWGEVFLGLAIAVRPTPILLVIALGWKVGTEALYPAAGAPFWEFVERAGSYTAPLALLILHAGGARQPLAFGRTTRGRDIATAGLASLLCLGPAAAGAMVVDRPTVAPWRAESAWHNLPTVSQQDLIDRLRKGELVLACRHAATDRSRGDARPVDLGDPSTQRILSDEGRRQARQLGRVFDQLDVPVGEVLASPYHRTRESAELAFGRVRISDALAYGNRPEQRRVRRRLLSAAPAGGNRVLMTHQGVLYGSLDVSRGSVREGDCVVVEPRGHGESRVLGRFGPDDFAAMGRASSTLLTHTHAFGRAPHRDIVYGADRQRAGSSWMTGG